MKKIEIDAKRGFDVLESTERGQIATMVLPPGESTGGPENRHEDGDQWMYVLSGGGRVIVEENEIEVRENDLLLIERGERHEVHCEGDEPFVTMNFYAPPEY
ncbi:MAG: cupin domain-containing protein [Thermoanaerobaculia bacterium]|nr:cupin domain-containing protein [Thermoanaerobaculia bacterium]